MILRAIKEELAACDKPVAKIIKSGSNYNLLAVGLKKGVTWQDHKTAMPTKLIVIEGSVIYQENGGKVPLMIYDEFEIPVNIIHSLEAAEDSLCMLIRGE
ncbi:hypothetical protein [Mucilaginibacter antarcticus]|uniref:Quercetin dioxygenase-like cupin family protein n=1 Tax=Mucilaginibacter antarcticus TaxID=1855725 RepID=A0ABW5XUR8_9SPHI